MMVPLPDASRFSSRPSWWSMETTWIRTRLGATFESAAWTAAVSAGAEPAEDWAATGAAERRAKSSEITPGRIRKV